MNRRVLIAVAGAILWSLTAAAADSWVLFGSARGFTAGCEPSYVWATQTIFHNTASFDRQIAVLHQSGNLILPPVITVRAGESLPLWPSFTDVPPAGLSAVRLDVPSDVAVESRLEYRNILPCSGQPPALGPSGKIALDSFRVVDAGQAQHHYGLDLGTQSVRVNVGVYNASMTFATATVELRRPSCSDPAITVITLPPDTLLQMSVPVPPICPTPSNPHTPYYLVNATVTVDQPSFSYATIVSNVQPPNVTFGVGAH
jgi:hypothetical protein